MAKSTRQYVFEGMEVLPEALTPFVEKRLESALTGQELRNCPPAAVQGHSRRQVPPP